ncbi:MAG: NAD(P)H-hydrate dehydratase [Planctomycetes bacterium]|nr:NAD(P)H-hydrate dehydratase [Planctomycetota bacterium]
MAELSSAPLPRLKRRPRDSHKGDFGRVLLIGGSRGMAGAMGLAGMSALRGGAGLVTLAVPEPCLETVAGYEPSYMTIPLPNDAKGRILSGARRELAKRLDRADVVACGPGLGRSEGLVELCGWLYETVQQPAVFDADGLNALAARPESLHKPGGPRVLTPHVGEFLRLLGLTHPSPLSEGKVDWATRGRYVADFAQKWQCILVLKGHRTIISDGREIFENNTGNPGMATGGSGDVLTGLITALLGQGMSPLDAARLGVYVHGRAGDLAAEEKGEVSLIARDLIDFLPAALKEVSE